MSLLLELCLGHRSWEFGTYFSLRGWKFYTRLPWQCSRWRSTVLPTEPSAKSASEPAACVMYAFYAFFFWQVFQPNEKATRHVCFYNPRGCAHTRSKSLSPLSSCLSPFLLPLTTLPLLPTRPHNILARPSFSVYLFRKHWSIIIIHVLKSTHGERRSGSIDYSPT